MRYRVKASRLRPVLAGVVALISLASTAIAIEQEIEAARQQFADCQSQHVSQVNSAFDEDRRAALELTNHCLSHYRAWVKRVARKDFDNSNEQRMFAIDQFSYSVKIEVSLPVVTRNR